jgi:hypothetical protein
LIGEFARENEINNDFENGGKDVREKSGRLVSVGQREIKVRELRRLVGEYGTKNTRQHGDSAMSGVYTLR